MRAAPVPEPITLESESETEDPASPVAPTLKSPASDLFVSESPSPEPEPDYILAEITTTGNNDEDIMTSEPKIPSKLLTALLHHHFQDDKTRVTKDAAKLYAKYIDIFVREAVARAVYERKEKLETETFGSTRIQTMADSFLEVCTRLYIYIYIFRNYFLQNLERLRSYVIGRRLGEVGSSAVAGFLNFFLRRS